MGTPGGSPLRCSLEEDGGWLVRRSVGRLACLLEPGGKQAGGRAERWPRLDFGLSPLESEAAVVEWEGESSSAAAARCFSRESLLWSSQPCLLCCFSLLPIFLRPWLGGKHCTSPSTAC